MQAHDFEFKRLEQQQEADSKAVTEHLLSHQNQLNAGSNDLQRLQQQRDADKQAANEQLQHQQDTHRKEMKRLQQQQEVDQQAVSEQMQALVDGGRSMVQRLQHQRLADIKAITEQFSVQQSQLDRGSSEVQRLQQGLADVATTNSIAQQVCTHLCSPVCETSRYCVVLHDSLHDMPGTNGLPVARAGQCTGLCIHACCFIDVAQDCHC